MQQVAILGDTHVPSRQPEIPEWVVERVRDADHVVHVGDFDDPAVRADLRDRAPELTAVHGNMDPDDLDAPAVATRDVEGVRFVVSHGTGNPEGYEQRLVDTAVEHADNETTVAVGGHVHTPIDKHVDGVRLLNPGSATGASPARHESMITATVDGTDLDVAFEWGGEAGTVQRD
jgi:putative phosphoesterase